jgi:beta-lactamase class A
MHGLLLALLMLAAACTSGAPQAPAGPAVRTADGARPAQAFASDLAPLEQAIRERIGREPRGDFGIAVIDLETGRSLGVNETLVMHAASTMKVGVLLALYRAAAEGRFSLDDRIAVRNRFQSIADTSHYSLSAEEDSEPELYRLVGASATLRDLTRRMIVRSSNLATNILIDTLRAERVRATLARVNASGMDVQRGVEDSPAFRAGLNNTTDAAGFARTLAAIGRCDILPHQLCAELTGILLAQEFNEMIPAGLPPGTRVAHKTGWITGINHDGGIIFPEGSPPYVLVVLTRNAADTTAARRLAADVARLTWSALGPNGSLRPRWNAETAALLALHERVRVPAFPAPTLRHAELWQTLAPIVDASPLLASEQISASAEGRPLRLIRFGSGPKRVLLWSQMHGDETTASRALTDLFHYIAVSDDARVRHWRERLTVLAIPMLNPDGAEAHRRRSVFGVDINRDARLLSTPEARALKAAQERFRPDFGFNLHDQNPRTRVGTTSRTAAISLLAPPPDRAATATAAFVRAQQPTALLATTLSPLVGRHITRYDDSYNARAFGDGMQSWGVSTVLIETGSWRGEETKHFLRKVNFVALVSALDAIASGAYTAANVAAYATLPPNGRSLNDLLIRGGTLVLPGREPHRADIAIDAASVGGPSTTQIADIGDLAEVEARDTLDASGLFIHLPAGTETVQPGHALQVVLRRTADSRSEAVWVVNGTRRRQLSAADNPFAGSM